MATFLKQKSSSKVEAVASAKDYLLEGIDIYQVDKDGSVSAKKKALWMEPNLLRICIEDKKTDRVSIQKGKVPTGICLRDISELRLGCDAFNFKHTAAANKEDDCCFSIIGTERTLSMITPTKYSRDQFLKSLQLVIDSHLTPVELLFKERSKLVSYDMEDIAAVQSSISAFKHLITVERQGAEGGIHVMHHTPGGKIVPSKIWFSPDDRYFHVAPEAQSMFSMSKQQLHIHIDDIAEVRPGTHSMGFIRTQSVNRQAYCLSIVGSEDTFDLEFPSNEARDLFALKTRTLIRAERTSGMDNVFNRSVSDASGMQSFGSADNLNTP